MFGICSFPSGIKHIFKWSVGFIVLMVLACLIAYDICIYLQYMGGEQDHIIQVILYETYNVQLLVPLLITSLSTCHHVWNCHWKQNPDPTVFSIQGHIIQLKFLQSLRKHRKDKGTFISTLVKVVMYFLPPAACMILMGFVFKNVKKQVLEEDMDERCLKNMILFRTAEISGVIFYGWFTVRVFLTRKKYQADFAEVAKGGIEDVEACQLKITQQWSKIQQYRHVVGWWLCSAMSLGVLALTVQFKWTFSGEYDQFAEKKEARLVTSSTYLQNSMMLLQPLFAVGSFNVDHIWDEFQEEFKQNAAIQKDRNNVEKEGNVSKTEDTNISKMEEGNASKIDEENASKMEEGNASKMEAGNTSKMEEGNASEMKEGNASEMEEGNTSKMKEGNTSKMEEKNGKEIITFGDEEKISKEKTKHDKLKLILKHIKQIHTSGPWMFTTLVFSIVSLVSTVSLPVQYAELWIRPGCSHNATSLNPSAF